MRKKEVISLISLSGSTTNDYGEKIPNRTARDILAERKSIRYGEFYQAKAAGFTPSITFSVWSVEYQQETLLIYNGLEYKIVRTYDTDEKNTELTCERLWKEGAT